MESQVNAVISLGQRTGCVRPVTRKEDIDIIGAFVEIEKFEGIWNSLIEVYPFEMSGRIALNCVFILLAREVEKRGTFCEDIFKTVQRGTDLHSYRENGRDNYRECCREHFLIRAVHILNFMPTVVAYICAHDEGVMRMITLTCIQVQLTKEAMIEWAPFMIRPDIVTKGEPLLFFDMLCKLDSSISRFAEQYPQLLLHFFPALGQNELSPGIAYVISKNEFIFLALMTILPHDRIGDLNAVLAYHIQKGCAKGCYADRKDFWSKVENLAKFGARICDEETACVLLLKCRCCGKGLIDLLRKDVLMSSRLFIYAVENNEASIARLQISKGIDLNKISSDGRLPLIAALFPYYMRDKPDLMELEKLEQRRSLGREFFSLISNLLGFDVEASYCYGPVGSRYADPFLSDANGISAFDMLIREKIKNETYIHLTSELRKEQKRRIFTFMSALHSNKCGHESPVSLLAGLSNITEFIVSLLFSRVIELF